jgi:hypothetical protein
MKVLKPGYTYWIPNFEDSHNGQTIEFVESQADPKTHKAHVSMDGCTNESLIEVLIDRLTFLNDKFPCRENSIAVTHLETALLWLKERTAKRVQRGVEGKHLA